jgi:hypothetical protein
MIVDSKETVAVGPWLEGQHGVLKKCTLKTGQRTSNKDSLVL